MLHAEKSGRPGRLCDVMMTCGHCLGRGFEILAHAPSRLMLHVGQIAREPHRQGGIRSFYHRAWLFIPTPTVIE